MPSREGNARGDPEWLTLGQAARYLGVAQSTIRKWSDQGSVPTFYTPGGHRRYRRGDLETFLVRSGPGRAQSGRLVLLVDDDDRLRELVRVTLELEGYTVREAGSAEEGMTAVEESKPDLILLDVMMPHVDGWEMLRRIQERRRRRRDPRGHVQRRGRRRGAASGRVERRERLRRQAVRPPAADRSDEGDRARLAHARRSVCSSCGRPRFPVRAVPSPGDERVSSRRFARAPR